MSNRNLTILAVVAAVVLAWAIVQSRLSNRRTVKTLETGPLIQGLETAAIDRIQLGTGPESVVLKRQDQGFVITDKDNYPAQTRTINELIANCLEIQTAELVTHSPSNHEDLEVTEEKARYLVKFFDAENQLITGVVVGKYADQGSGSYVRQVNSDEVYLAESSPYLQTQVLSYIDSRLIEVDQDEITQVQITIDQDDYILLQEPNETIVLAPTETETPPKLKQSVARQVYTALSSLYLTDVQKASPETAELDFNATYQCRLKDSTVYILQIATSEDKYYLKCRALFTDQTPVTIDRTKVDSEEMLQEKEAKLLARQAAQEFTARHQNWVYEIAAWKAENLTQNLSDLIEQ
ncbi:MAG: hypothetical protein AMJ79_07695 [Phycisphaerae bacterium SM23_30]|nr:MAG: hypothetical protein AMJ79_07695 [Phycisphaerae bacterium SM23_30]